MLWTIEDDDMQRSRVSVYEGYAYIWAYTVRGNAIDGRFSRVID
jgi:hypothetical protein